MDNHRLSTSVLIAFLFLFQTLCSARADEMPDPVRQLLVLYESRDFAQADLLLNQYLTDNPESPFRATIWLAAGRAYGSTVESTPFFRKITETFPDSPEAPLAQIELAQMHFICGNASTAAAEARRFLERWPSHEKRMDAMLLLATLDSQSGRIRSAANRYAEAVVRCSTSPRVAEAYAGLGDCKFRLDDLAGANDAYRQAIEKGNASLDVGKVYYQLGLIAQKRNRPEESRRYFMLLARHYPKTRYARQAEASLKSLGETGSTILPGTADQLLTPLSLPKAAFSVKAGSYDSRDQAERLAGKLTKAGHEVDIEQRNDRFEVRVGRFSGEMDAFFFAEQLQRKFGLKTEILSLEQ